jgi:hypothetical protein
MSQEHDKSSRDPQVSDGIKPEAAPFEPGYQPETLPKISVPDLADDAQGLTAEALAQIPTLTEEAPSKEAVDTSSEEPVVPELITFDDEVTSPVEPVSPQVEIAPIQDTPVQADTWGEELHARMGKLTDDIHTLNIRLDRLEERNKAKV